MKFPTIKAIHNVGDGLIKFYCDDEFIIEWVCEDDDGAELSLEGFIEVFSAGMKAAGVKVACVGYGDIERGNE